MDKKGFKETIRWYEEHAKKYAQITEKQSSPEQIAEFVPLLPKNAKVLDAGCGGGRDTKLLSERGINTVGIDLSSELVRLAKEKYPDINFVEGNFLDLPFEDNYFDGIWAHASLLHFEKMDDVKKALFEFNRTLKKDGVLHVLVKVKTGKEKNKAADSHIGGERFFQYFTQDELKDLLKETGFEGIKTERYKEIDRNPKGRPGVEWILSLSRKV